MYVERHYYNDGTTKKEICFNNKGRVFAERSYYISGSIEAIKNYHPDGKTQSHCKKYYENGNPHYEMFYNEEGVFHNEDGYALKHWYENGNPEIEIHYINGEVFLPQKEWNEGGSLLADIYQVKLHSTLSCCLPVRIVTEARDGGFYTVGGYPRSYKDYSWLVEFDNGARIPYPLMDLWEEELYDDKHVAYVGIQQKIIKDYYNKRPELKEAFFDLNVKMNSE